MEESVEILNSLKKRFGEECILEQGGLNRELIAGKVFSCEEDRRWLNSLVHAEVRRDISEWMLTLDGEVAFVESAIMVTSGLDKMCDRIMLVEAPENLRIMRTMRRGGISRENLSMRIESQRAEFDSLPAGKVVRISNCGNSSLLEAVALCVKGME